MLAVLVCNKSFRSKVGFNICKRLVCQFFETFFIWLEGNATVYEKSQVRPDIVYGLQVVAGDHIFDTHLYPRRDPDNKTNIPMRRLLNDRFDLLVPITGPGNLFARSIKRGEPERHPLSCNATKVTGIIPGPLLKV